MNTRTSYAELEADCAIWICLPGGFPAGCEAALDAFRKRIKKGRAPRPALPSCMAKPGFYVSYETIYQFVYSDEGRSLKLYRCLCQPVQNRHRRMGRKPRHLRGIPLEMGINKRPDHINARKDFGHWEGNLMIFRRENEHRRQQSWL